MEIYIVEDSPRVVSRIGEMLATLPGVILLGHAPDAESAIQAILKWRPDVVLTDLKLAAGTGYDVLMALQDAAPEIGVYMLSNFNQRPYRELAIELGAKGFFDKSTDFDKLRELVATQASRGAIPHQAHP